MSKRLYPKFSPDEWIQPVRRGLQFQCCDCGLVHLIDFRVVKGRVQFRLLRDNRKTAAVRRERRKRGEL